MYSIYTPIQVHTIGALIGAKRVLGGSTLPYFDIGDMEEF
jgi:hypothetical protein